MSKVVEKKILPVYFTAVADGTKTFEIRKDEDDIQVGDVLILREWYGNYTGKVLKVSVTYVLRDCPGYGLKDGFAIYGLGKAIEENETVNEQVALAKLCDAIYIVEQMSSRELVKITLETARIARDALKKQIPIKPVLLTSGLSVLGCPSCRRGVAFKYCPECGQRMDWGQE